MSLLALLAAKQAGPPNPTPTGQPLAAFWSAVDAGERVVITTTGDSLTDIGGDRSGDGWVPQFTRLFEADHGPIASYTKLDAYTVLDPAPMAAPGVHIFNTGIGGRTSYSYMGDAVGANVLASEPTLVTHMVGMNDYSFTDGSPEAVVNHIKGRVDYIDANSAQPVTHVLMVEPRRTPPIPEPDRPADWWDRYGTALHDLAAADPDRRVVVDVDAAFGATEGLRGSDGIHLTPAGNEVVAATVYEAVMAAKPTA